MGNKCFRSGGPAPDVIDLRERRNQIQKDMNRSGTHELDSSENGTANLPPPYVLDSGKSSRRKKSASKQVPKDSTNIFKHGAKALDPL